MNLDALFFLTNFTDSSFYMDNIFRYSGFVKTSLQLFYGSGKKQYFFLNIYSVLVSKKWLYLWKKDDNIKSWTHCHLAIIRTEWTVMYIAQGSSNYTTSYCLTWSKITKLTINGSKKNQHLLLCYLNSLYRNFKLDHNTRFCCCFLKMFKSVPQKQWGQSP